MASSLHPLLRTLLTAIALFCATLAAPSWAQQSPSAEVQTSWRLLDYIAVDYREAVRDGKDRQSRRTIRK